MEFLQLRYFYESANAGSLSKAAEKYRVPASSVSASIKRLEQELGCRLFERTANRITLNENGKKLHRSLSLVFTELESTLGNISDTGSDTREVRILVKAMRSLVTDYAIAYKTAHADAKFTLISDFDEQHPEEYDIIIDTKSEQYGAYEYFELCRQHVQLYAAESSPLRDKALTLRELANEPFVSMSPQGNQYKLLINACAKAGYSPTLVAQINDAACFFKFIASGVAIGAAGERAASVVQGIYPLQVEDFCEEQTVCVYYKKQNAWGNVRRFIEFLKKSL